MFGHDRGSTATRIGIRSEVVGEILHVDLVYGRNLTDEARDRVTVGASLAF